MKVKDWQGMNSDEEAKEVYPPCLLQHIGLMRQLYNDDSLVDADEIPAEIMIVSSLVDDLFQDSDRVRAEKAYAGTDNDDKLESAAGVPCCWGLVEQTIATGLPWDQAAKQIASQL